MPPYGRHNVPPYVPQNVPSFAREKIAPFVWNVMSYGRENIGPIDKDNIPPHGRDYIPFYAKKHAPSLDKEQGPPFVDGEKPSRVAMKREEKQTVDREKIHPFERENRESVVRDEKSPFARSDKFRTDMEKAPEYIRKKLDPFTTDQVRTQNDYPNDIRVHRRKPMRNHYVESNRQPNFYDYDYHRMRRGPYRQPYDNRQRYYDDADYFQPRQYARETWPHRTQNPRYFRQDENKQNIAHDSEAKRKVKQENQEILKKIMENHKKDLVAERENIRKIRMSTVLNIGQEFSEQDFVKEALGRINNKNREPVTEIRKVKSDSNTSQKHDQMKHEEQTSTLKQMKNTESLTEKVDDNYHEFTLLITRKNYQHQNHFTHATKNNKIKGYATVSTPTGGTTNSWFVEKYEDIVGQVDRQFEDFLRKQRNTEKAKTAHDENKVDSTERLENSQTKPTTTAKWFWVGDNKVDASNTLDSSYQTTDKEVTNNNKPNRIYKKNSYEDYYDNKFKEIPPGPRLGQHFFLKHLNEPQCVKEFTQRLPPDFSPPPHWKDSEEEKNTKRAPIILTRGQHNYEKQGRTKHPGELNNSEEQYETFAQSYNPEEKISRDTKNGQEKKPKSRKNNIFDLKEHPHNEEDNYEAKYSTSDDHKDEKDEMMYDNAGKSDQSDSQLDKLLDRIDQFNFNSGRSSQADMSKKKGANKKEKKKQQSLPYYTSAEWQEKRNNRPRHVRSLGQNLTEDEQNYETGNKEEITNIMTTYDEFFEMYHNPHMIEDNKDYSTLYQKRKPAFDNTGEERHYEGLNKFIRRPMSREINDDGKWKNRRRRSLIKAKRDTGGMINKTTRGKSHRTIFQDLKDTLPDAVRNKVDLHSTHEITNKINQMLSTTAKKVTIFLDHTTKGTTKTTPDFLANFYKAFSQISPTTGSTDISSYIHSVDIGGE